MFIIESEWTQAIIDVQRSFGEDPSFPLGTVAYAKYAVTSDGKTQHWMDWTLNRDEALRFDREEDAWEWGEGMGMLRDEFNVVLLYPANELA